MKKILLTSAGFENKRIEEKFIVLAGKKPAEIKALFIPTAANSPEAKAVLPKCRADLSNAGIPEENVVVYDLDRIMPYEELKQYDAVYFCGGSSNYLLERMHAVDFVDTIRQYVEQGGIYIGVSAGSLICTDNHPDGPGFVRCRLSVHCSEGSGSGIIDPAKNPKIALTDRQAILIADGDIRIIE
jgi:peptidase E